MVIGKVAKQVGQRWRGSLRYVVSADNEHREKFEFEELEGEGTGIFVRNLILKEMLRYSLRKILQIVAT